MLYKYTHPKNILVQGVLTYDTKLEEGRVRHCNVPKDVVGLDILQDWILDLQAQYHELQEELFTTRKDKQ
jgi:hypothetical protein